MYLKTIEMQGFKSFANKIQLKFEKGITAIVGPNGSGKSNVADAVRWVLGEQSAKQLRGSKMEDVIFAGTENRRPLSYCQVALTINNTDRKLPIDYSEVTVSRRVYRSGESEYILNGTSCRLKDIQELFFDTGIGKEGYSIIGQGQIDKILSSKPDDRRNLFDEAAGIVKYKKRKQIAETKLDKEKQNLLRVNDILSELESQIKPLEEQAEVAKKYLGLKDQQKKYEINIFIEETKKNKQQIEEIQQREKVANDELQTTKDKLNYAKEQFDNLEKELEDLTITVDKIKENIATLQLDKEKLENKINITTEQIIAIKNNNNHINERINTVQQQLKELTQQEEHYKSKKTSVEKKTLENKNQLSIYETKHSNISEQIDNQIQIIEKNKSEIIEVLNVLANINSKLQRYETMKEHITIRKSELHQKFMTIKIEEKTKKQEQLLFNDNNSILVEKINKISQEKNNIEKDIKEVHNRKAILKKEIESTKKDFHQYQSKYDTINSLTQHYEGYAYSIKKVMELQQKDVKINSGIIGVVADVIKVKKDYEVAIEIALGGSIQNIITDNDLTAKKLVNYLKENKFGRATFLPLNNIKRKGNYNQHEVLQEQSVLGLASDLVNYDYKYKHLIEYLLGRVIVVDHIDHAIQISKKYHQSLRMVTLSGELFNIGGSITGGSYKNNHNLLSRKRELNELEILIKELSDKINNKKQEYEKIKHKEQELTDQYDNIKSNIQKYILEQNSAQITQKQMKEQIEKLNEQKQDIEKEIIELDKQSVDVTLQIERYNQELESLKNNNDKYEKEIEEINILIGKDKKNLYEYQETITKLRIEQSSLKQESDYVQESLKRTLKENNQLNSEYNTLQKTLEKNYDNIEEKTKNIQHLKNEISKNIDKTESSKQELLLLQNNKVEKNQLLKLYFNKREKLSDQLSLLDKELFRLKNQQEKYKEQVEELYQYMWAEYELTFHQALNYKEENQIQISALKKKVQKIKQEIKDLGAVNVNAIENYKDIIERYTFLQTQKDDLQQAEEKLIDIINELDEAMRKQFREKFTEINEQFGCVFKELFGGGKALLELTDNEEILESGIKIIAQPPGKKLQNMMLLSGGERAFTAIALLFAIQTLKPSPFCLLDEIEAALDDSNVYRFSEYLHKLTNDTQFIVITHRKGTMEASDALYGITMQEKGVSTLVSVKLIENEISM